LANVAEAERASEEEDWTRVTELLGTWPAPLAIFWRTPEGQMIAYETSILVAKGLGLLGTAYVALGEVDRAEDVFRLAIQYGQDSAVSAEIFAQFGGFLLRVGRAGEAIGLLRRALALGAHPVRIQPLLAKAFCQRGRFVAARGCLMASLDGGVSATELGAEIDAVRGALGFALEMLPVGMSGDQAV